MRNPDPSFSSHRGTTPSRRAPAPAIRRAILFFIGAGLFLAMMFMPATAGAYSVDKHDDQVTGQFVISPTNTELDMKPGETTSRDIMLSNRTGDTITIQFSVEDIQGSQDGQAPTFLGDRDSAYGARHWLTPELTSITLKQAETLTMSVNITVPETTEPGGHYAAVLASTQSISNQSGSALNITSRIPADFLITVAGAMNEDGSLNPPQVPFFSEYGPIDIGLIFNNIGNVHLKPHGQINIKNFLGRVVASIPVQDWVVLPQSSRSFASTWDTHYLFGRYTAEAVINYGDGKTAIVASSFWVIPWKIILAVIAALIIFVFLLAWVTRERRQQRRAMREEREPRQGSPPAGAPMVAPEGLVATPLVEPEAVEDPPGEPPPGPSTHVALNELFPSMNDTRVVDIADPETKKLLRNMIANELDLARAFLAEGKHDEARVELQEARYAAQRLGLLAEVGIIDDMMRWV